MASKKSNNSNRLAFSNISSTSLLEVSVLYFLKQADVPTFGKQILISIDKTFGKSWQPSHSNLYTSLARLEKLDYVKSVYSDKRRIFYVITPKGVDFLEEKILEYKDPLLESKSFFDNVISTFYGNEVNL